MTTGSHRSSRGPEVKDLIQRQQRPDVSKGTQRHPEGGQRPQTIQPIAEEKSMTQLDPVPEKREHLPPAITTTTATATVRPAAVEIGAGHPTAGKITPDDTDLGKSQGSSRTAVEPTLRAPASEAQHTSVESAPSRAGGDDAPKRIVNQGLLADIAGGAKLKSVSSEDKGSGTSQPSGRMSPDMLSSISKGAQLKTTAAEPLPTVVRDPKMSMLQEIKMNKTRLKHVEEQTGVEVATKKAPAPSLGKAALFPLDTSLVCF
jgi:hypothetical protein